MRSWQVESRFEGGTGRVGEVWEWLGWWLDWEGVGCAGGSWRDLEDQKTDWGLLGDSDLDECWALMPYRHSPEGVLWAQGI